MGWPVQTLAVADLLGAAVRAARRSSVVTSTRRTPSQPWQITWNVSGRRMGRATAWRYPQHSHVTMARISPLAPPRSSGRFATGLPGLAEPPEIATRDRRNRPRHGTATRPLHGRVMAVESVPRMCLRSSAGRAGSGRSGRR